MNNSTGKAFEDQLRDVVYATVGLGIVAYKLSEPYRRRLESLLGQCLDKCRGQETAERKATAAKSAGVSD